MADAEGFALEHVDAERHQFVGVAAVDGAGGDLDLGEVAADQFGDGEDAVAAGDGDDDHLGLGGAGGAQDVEARAVAVEHLDAEALDQLDLRRIVVDQGHLEALGAQQAGDDLAEAAIAEDDRPCCCSSMSSGRGLGGRRRIEPRHHERSKSSSRNGVVAIESATTTVSRSSLLRRRLPAERANCEDDEGELAGLAEEDGEQQAVGEVHAEERREHEEHDDLDADERDDEASTMQRLCEQHARRRSTCRPR